MRLLSVLPTAPIAALGLVLGYLVADLTGVRAVGGAVLIAALAVCAGQWRARVGLSRTAGLISIYLALFAASHLLALAIGAWPSVITVAALMYLATMVLADRIDRADRADRVDAGDQAGVVPDPSVLQVRGD